MTQERNFFVLAYDIANDKRRAKIAKAMEAVGERVQGSVFEAYLTAAELDGLVRKTRKIMKESEDGLRVYSLCAACRGKTQTHGCGRLTPAPGLVIV